MATEGGHKNMVDYLVDKGTDISLKDDAGVRISEYTLVNRFVYSFWFGFMLVATIEESYHISVHQLI